MIILIRPDSYQFELVPAKALPNRLTKSWLPCVHIPEDDLVKKPVEVSLSHQVLPSFCVSDGIANGISETARPPIAKERGSLSNGPIAEFQIWKPLNYG